LYLLRKRSIINDRQSLSRLREKRLLNTQLVLGTVFMKAQIYVNRHIQAANKRATKETKILTDHPAIAVKTYKGSVYCKEVEFTKGGKLIQNAENARCSGATIWIEVDDFESLILDGVAADNSMFNGKENLTLEDYFWQFVEDFKAIKNENYIALSRYLNPKYAADKQALITMFKELREKLQQKLDRRELELSIDEFDDLTASIIGLGKNRYCSALKNPKSAMYLTDSIKSIYSVLNLLN
jgi:hypothetical protein